jgi:glycogen phosphorylase
MLRSDQIRVRAFKVVPSLPPELRPLLDIAYNLWWSWHPEAVELFVRLDRQLWQDTKHNPVKLLGHCPQEILDRAARDEGYLTSMQRVVEGMQQHLTRTPWHVRDNKETSDFKVAYFSAEFGITESLQIYSGGLGCLAGDHLKSAAELGLPLIGVGLLYRHGYFQQYLNADGWQQEYYPDLDFANLPLSRVKGEGGKPLKVTVDMPGRQIHIAVWRVQVGTIELFLLDTNLLENESSDRVITGQLYGGDMETRIKQELVLGIGGIRALEAMGIEPDVCHMNEGHSAFLALERIRKRIEQHNLSFDEARQMSAAANVFTTHTPVPAGIDRFPPDMIERYFKAYVSSLKLDMEGLLALGRENVYNKNEFFSMAVLAIRTSDWANGVSKLHGEVSRDMWKNMWPGLPESEVPITHVTNGVHARSWLSADLIQLFDHYLGNSWQTNPVDHTVWKSIYDVPDEELWRVHERRRQKLIVWLRRKLKTQLEARGETPVEIQSSIDALDPNALTIGFARRFATYKRASLLLRDIDRLEKLLGDTDRPIQFVIAGKSHPADGGGKDLIRQMVHFAHESKVGHKIVFVENYDIHVARYLVTGCDVWLNTPRRGMEASGTSGMKAALNGVLNCSILDGWWDEAYEQGLGWAIGRGEEYANPDVADDVESNALYDLLEKQIIPTFYDRDSQRVPRQWLALMKKCISQLAPEFNTNRMVQQYTENLYLPALRRSRKISDNSGQLAVELAHQKDRLRQAWPKIKVEQVDADLSRPIGVHDQLDVSVTVSLAQLDHEEVRVQVYSGSVDNDGQVVDGVASDLKHVESLDASGDGNRHRFEGQLIAKHSGKYGFAVRIIPGGELFRGPTEPGLILWDAAPTPVTPVPKKDEIAAVI